MTGKESYNVPEPYDREKSDTCDYIAPQVSLSSAGSKLIATVKKGSSPISGATLYVDGEEVKNGAIVKSGGVEINYTIDNTETSIKLLVTDTAGYTAASELTLTPTSSASSGSSGSSSGSSSSTSGP